jgi:hypothetical protein
MKKSDIVSYIALGVSVVALAVAVFCGCHKKPRHPEFGGDRHHEAEYGRRGGDKAPGERGPGFDAERKGRQGAPRGEESKEATK